MRSDQATQAIAERFPRAQVEAAAPDRQTPGDGDLVVTLTIEDWAPFALFAKNGLGCRFFSFLTAVDWKDLGLEVVTRLENLDERLSLTMKTRLGPGVSACPSLTPLYRGAGWMERECFEMFGIRFDGHPDLRRLLLTDDWEGHPLLKSYAVDTPHAPYR